MSEECGYKLRLFFITILQRCQISSRSNASFSTFLLLFGPSTYNTEARCNTIVLNLALLSYNKTN